MSNNRTKLIALNKVIQAYKTKRTFEFLHLPVNIRYRYLAMVLRNNRHYQNLLTRRKTLVNFPSVPKHRPVIKKA